MRILPRIVAMLLLLVFVMTCGRNNLQSQTDEVIVGEVPQQVEDEYVPEPDGYQVEVWQENLNIPWSLVFLPNGDALVSERSGTIRLIREGEVQSEPYAEIDVAHQRGSEAGLMGLALHPEFPNTPYVYVMYTYDGPSGRLNRVARLRHNGTTGEMANVILDDIPGGRNHDGGRIAFGPDGMLYVCAGETFQRELAQDENSLGGKILRLTPEGDIPSDNPFPDSPIYSMGNRNPQGLAWHPETGDLFESEHGPSGEFGLRARDEINVIYPGENYGWPRVVGAAENSQYVDPLIMWENTTPPSGMTFFNGALFVATLRSEALIRISMEYTGDNYQVTGIQRWFVSSNGNSTYGRLRAAVVGPDGALYVLTSNQDGRGNPRTNDDKILRITSTD